ncbi:hypothetical protein HUU53_04800 [Candidatus Micrarchaeota archaeon]|nr:hypothetical protein [Candidatus Micrarchaeota archaeon]
MAFELVAAGIIVLILALGTGYFLFSRQKESNQFQSDVMELYNDSKKARLTLAFFRFDGKKYFFDALLKNNLTTSIEVTLIIGNDKTFLEAKPGQTASKQIILEKPSKTQVELFLAEERVFADEIDFKEFIEKLRERNELHELEEEVIQEKTLSSDEITGIEELRSKPKTDFEKEIEETLYEEKELQNSFLKQEISKDVFDDLNKEIQKKKIKLKAKYRKKS